MKIPQIYLDIPSNSTHLLVAGATGSGKSTAIHGIIAGILATDPRTTFSFIDLKQVEMIEYKRRPFTRYYADTPEKALQVLETIRADMLQRYTKLKRKRVKQWDGPKHYIIIDEYAELWIQTRKTCIPVIQSILQLGRAAGYHAIIATQIPLAKILDTAIKVNIDGVLALRTRSAQDSRNIIGFSGAETLPRYGYGFFTCPALLKPLRVKLPLLTEKTKKKITG